MAEQTNIAWADSTANLWIGCTKLSPGCDHCYAERDWDLRKHRVVWGPHGDRSPVAAGWKLIRKMQRRAEENGGVDPDLGRTRRIFVNSLSDFFDNHGSVTWRQDAFSLFEASRHLILMLVTKRPENVKKMVPAHWLDGQWPAHVWLLVSAEDQERADHRIPILLSIPGIAVRGVSIEPLLGPMDIVPYMGGRAIECGCGFRHDEHFLFGATLDKEYCALCGKKTKTWPTLDWVIVGGESGPKARDCHIPHIRGIVQQCTAAGGVPVFVKQLGARPRGWCAANAHIAPSEAAELDDDHCDFYEAHELGQPCPGRCAAMADAKGGNMAEWPEDLRVRDFPKAQADEMNAGQK